MPAMALSLDHPNDIQRLIPWQVDFRQLDPGPLATRLTVGAGRAVAALHIAMNRRVHQRGASPDGWMTFGIPRRDAIDSWQGRDLTAGAFLAFGDSDGFDGISTAGFAGNVISLKTSQMQALALSCGFDLETSPADARKVTSASRQASLARLDRCVTALLSDPDATWTTATEETLMLEALRILTDQSAHFDQSHAATRRRALTRAIDLMVAHLDEPVSIAQLARQAGASWRTLDRAFQEQFGYGPKTYYLRLRLGRVREHLLKAPPDCTITDVANQHGFWHLGQFARDYRLFFGELPSQTLGKGA